MIDLLVVWCGDYHAIEIHNKSCYCLHRICGFISDNKTTTLIIQLSFSQIIFVKHVSTGHH